MLVEVAAPVETVRQRDQQIARLVSEHLGLVWRTLRRLGVDSADLEDATQKVFIIVSQRLAAIEPGCERSFVFGTALRVASAMRRKRRHRREEGLENLDDQGHESLGPEANLERREAVEIMAAILERMSEELRTTFVLFELEQMTMAEIAAMLDVPLGTVASRLRRSRARFRQEVRELEALEGTVGR